MMTLKGSIRRAAMVVLAAGVLAIGALACGFQNNDEAVAELDTKLDRVDELTTENVVKMEVYEARITRLEEENAQLSGRIAQLEQDKQVLMDLVNGIVAQIPGAGAAIAGAALLPGAAGPAESVTRETATEEQRAMVRQWVECGLKSGGTPESLIAAMAGTAEDAVWIQIESGEMTVAEVETGLPIVCAGQ